MKILLPLDGSELAEQALETAVSLARKWSGEILAVRVVNSFASGIPDLVQAESEVTAAYLRSIEKRLSRLEIAGSTLIASGHPVEEIARATEPVDLVVMASHGRSGPGRWLLGSVAEGVLRKSRCPVLLCRGTAPVSVQGFTRVLVPVDGSPDSDAVAGQLDAFLAPEARLTLLRAADSLLRQASMSLDEPTYRGYLESLSQELQRLDPAARFVHRIMDCEPAEAILTVAREAEADLIAMATHGRTGLHRFLLGSITERVARHAGCSVLAFPPKPKEVAPRSADGDWAT